MFTITLFLGLSSIGISAEGTEDPDESNEDSTEETENEDTIVDDDEDTNGEEDEEVNGEEDEDTNGEEDEDNPLALLMQSGSWFLNHPYTVATIRFLGGGGGVGLLAYLLKQNKKLKNFDKLSNSVLSRITSSDEQGKNTLDTLYKIQKAEEKIELDAKKTQDEMTKLKNAMATFIDGTSIDINKKIEIAKMLSEKDADALVEEFTDTYKKDIEEQEKQLESLSDKIKSSNKSLADAGDEDDGKDSSG